MATGDVKYITEVYLNDETFWLLSAEGGTGWFIPNSALSVSTTFTATTTSASATLTSVSSTSGLYIGQLLSGTGIQAGSRITAIDSGASTVTMSLTATANGSGVTITRTHMAKIIDSDFPTEAQGPFVELDGRVYIGCTDGSIRGSDLNSITAWSAANSIQTPESSVVVVRHNEQILAIGKNKIVPYFNAGNSGSVLGRSSSPEINIGTSDFNNVVTFRDWTFFIGQDTGPETSGIWMLSGFSVDRLTSIPVTRILSQNEATLNANVVVLSAFEHQGKQMVNFGMGTSSAVTASFNYCLESKEWVESGYDRLYKFSEGLNAISLSDTAGRIYIANPLTPTYQDVGATAYSAIIQTSPVDHGTSLRKTDRDVVLICDKQSSGTVTLETNDNDYDSSSWVTRGTFDLTQARPKISRCGSYKGRRSYRLTHSANTAFRAEALEMDVTVEET